MRRPSQNAKQRQFAREQRAIRALIRAAVRYANALDTDADDHYDVIAAGFRETELHGKALCLANTLTTRDRRRLSK